MVHILRRILTFPQRCPKTVPFRRDSSGPKYQARQIGVFFKEYPLFGKLWCPSFGRFGRFSIFFEKYAHLVRPPPNGRESGSMRPHSSQIEHKKRHQGWQNHAYSSKNMPVWRGHYFGALLPNWNWLTNTKWVKNGHNAAGATHPLGLSLLVASTLYIIIFNEVINLVVILMDFWWQCIVFAFNYR